MEEKEVTREEVEHRQALVAQMQAFGERFEGRHISLGNLILEGREELEERA